MRRSWLGWIGIASVSCGLLLFWVVSRSNGVEGTDPPPSGAPVAGSSPPIEAVPRSVERDLEQLKELLREKDAELAAVRDLLGDTAELLAQVDEEVDWMRTELAWLRRERGAAGDTRDASSPKPTEAASPDASPRTPPLFDGSALLAAGVDPTRVDFLRRRFEESELERLYLRDEAAREGWLDTDRYRITRLTQAQELKRELGPEGYDQMLYAAGRRNRVVVRNVISGSSAERSGLEPGDVLMSYAGQRVYSVFDLQGLSRQGEAGTPVPVDVLREGRMVRVSMPRGPLGVTIDAQRALP